MVRTATPLDRVHQLLALYGGPDTSAARVLCDDHPADAVGYTVIAADLTHRDLTYGDLRLLSERFAAALASLGVGPGDRVATLMGKSTEYLVTLLGIWRLGAVHVPLFTAFAPPAILLRVEGGAAKVVVCDTTQRWKLSAEPMPADPPWCVVVAGGPTPDAAPTDLGFADLMDRQEPGFPAAVLGGDAPIVHIYTSGTTGQPKGVVVPTRALAGFRAYGEFGLHLTADDLYWCAADPGWAYGLYFGILSSLTTGVRSLLLNAPFSAASTWQVLQRFPVTSLAAAPTVYRSLRGDPHPIPTGLCLRRATSAGEPLTPEVNEWAAGALGVPVHDHYGQTEAGMLVNNHHHPELQTPLRAGSMGMPMPGWGVRVLLEDRDEEAPSNVVGRIAVEIDGSPLTWFTGYLNDPARSHEKFSADGRWYLTGDAGRVDDDGYFFFSSRDDDVIIMAGYRIGPFEVESVLLTHPLVAESAVIAVPDEIRGEVLEAYVVLREGQTGTSDLAEELKAHVKTRYGAHAYPRAVHVVPELPKTPSGKIQRYVLRQRRREELEQPRSPRQRSPENGADVSAGIEKDPGA